MKGRKTEHQKFRDRNETFRNVYLPYTALTPSRNKLSRWHSQLLSLRAIADTRDCELVFLIARVRNNGRLFQSTNISDIAVSSSPKHSQVHCSLHNWKNVRRNVVHPRHYDLVSGVMERILIIRSYWFSVIRHRRNFNSCPLFNI